MKTYINGTELLPELEVKNQEAYEAMMLGEIFYLSYGRGIGDKSHPIRLIYKGWNSIHYIKLPKSVK